MQMPMSTKFEMRGDPGVVRNYGRTLVELAAVVPDGLVSVAEKDLGWLVLVWAMNAIV